MGGGDLNLKKSWHPGTFKNIELVFKREKQVEEELKKVEQLKKEKDEERKREELHRLAEAAGKVKKKSDRLEWMYAASGHGTAGVLDDDREAFLLGKKRIDAIVEQGKSAEEISKVETYQKNHGSFYGFYANTARDLHSKIRDDPLLAIKQREQMSLKSVLANPLQLKRLKESHEDKKDKKKKKKKNRDRSYSPEEQRKSISPERYARSSSRDISIENETNYNRNSRERSMREVSNRNYSRDYPRDREYSRDYPRDRHYSRELPSRDKHYSPPVDFKTKEYQEERMQKLERMQKAARDLDIERESRLKRAREEEFKEKEELITKGQDAFMAGLRRDMAMGQETMADMVGRKKFYSQKNI